MLLIGCFAWFYPARIGIIGLNLVVDLLYPVIDPRVGIGQSRRHLVARPSA